VIVWINGLFGVGKSTTAARLADALDAPPMDPEQIGFHLPEWSGNGGPVADFQDIPLWRSLTRETVAEMDRTFGVVVVHMSLLRADYFEEVICRLQREGHEVRHYTLVADLDTLVNRGAGREGGLVDWARGMNARHQDTLSDPRFESRIETEDVPQAQVVATILRDLPDLHEFTPR